MSPNSPNGGDSSSQATAKRAKQQAKQVGDTAGEQASEIVSAAGVQASEVASVTADQARALLGDLRSQVGAKVDSQSDQFADSVQRTAQQLRAISEGNTAEAGPILDYIRQAADALDRFAARMKERGFNGGLGDLQDFGRRKPGVFLMGAAAAGFAVARLIRASREADSNVSLSPTRRSSLSLEELVNGPIGAVPTPPSAPAAGA